MKPIANLRWWIAGLLAAATALNYLDRENLPVDRCLPGMRATLPYSSSQGCCIRYLYLLLLVLVRRVEPLPGFAPARAASSVTS